MTFAGWAELLWGDLRVVVALLARAPGPHRALGAEGVGRVGRWQAGPEARSHGVGAMDRIQRLFQAQAAAAGGGGAPEASVVDTSEMVYISSMALLKMLKHGRAGVPMEVMGLMLGEFVDDYTVKCVDVFAMPQSGTGVSVEAVDPVFQTKMLEMLKQVRARRRARAVGGQLVRVVTRRRAARRARFDPPPRTSARVEPPPTSATDGSAGDGGGLVPLAPGIRLLALGRRHQHTAIV